MLYMQFQRYGFDVEQLLPRLPGLIFQCSVSLVRYLSEGCCFQPTGWVQARWNSNSVLGMDGEREDVTMARTYNSSPLSV